MRSVTKHVLLAGIILAGLYILTYTRLVNLGWGLPYSMHPDERNMAWAIMRLSSHDGYNPHFFAYGQLPLYAAYLFVKAYQAFTKVVEIEISYQEAVIALRMISALVSVFTVILGIQCVSVLTAKKRPFPLFLAFLLFTFSPVLIQFSHYGTTEALLMFFFIWLLYSTLLRMKKLISAKRYYIVAAAICGLSVATKVSSLVYVALPLMLMVSDRKEERGKDSLLQIFFRGVKFVSVTAYLSFMFSPYNLIDFKGFLGSMHYESDVALGKINVFYTRAFEWTTPILFQFTHVFPYALGIGILIAFVVAFLLLPYTKPYILLRLSFLIVFVPNAFMYTKWTRFVAPAYPVMLLMIAMLFDEVYGYVDRVKTIWASVLKVDLSILALIIILPGIAYLAIYQTPDVRYTASYWINDHLPANSRILSETANVVDMPIYPPGEVVVGKPYEYISFDFYNVDSDTVLAAKMKEYINTADFIFVPSRRVFKNHTCLLPNPGLEKTTSLFESLRERVYAWEDADKCRKLDKEYPLLKEYYTRLFSGTLGYHQVAEFHSYPRITLFGTTLVEFPDEEAEETWSVFDHPVVRFYKKNI